MITEPMLDALRAEMKMRLKEKRFRHTLGVEKEMRALAKIYMPSRIIEAACVGLLHDVTKELSYKEQIELCEKYGIEVPDDEKNSAALLHAKTGAFYAREHYPDYVTEEMISAIFKHTTADAEMSLLDKLLYLADFIEEGRTYESCIALRTAFYDGISHRMDDKELFLNEILIQSYDYSLAALAREGLYISPATVKAREAALKERFALQGKK